MVLFSIAMWAFGQSATPTSAPTPLSPNQSDRNWIATSNRYTNLLIEITRKYAPEGASEQGLAQYDESISNPTLADEDARIEFSTLSLSKELSGPVVRFRPEIFGISAISSDL
jgi:hypothetical protein